MSKDLTFIITDEQLSAITDMANTIEAMIGSSEDFDTKQKENVRLFEEMMSDNGWERDSNN